MDENGAQESGMDFYAQFNSLKALKKKFLKSNHRTIHLKMKNL